MGRNKLVTAEKFSPHVYIWARSVAKFCSRERCVRMCVCENDIFEVFKFFYIFLWLLVGVYIELNSDDESFMSC